MLTFACAAVLLSVERVTYVWICRNPRAFRTWSTHLTGLGGPVDLLALLCAAFKIVQLGVFVGWHLAHSGGRLWPESTDVPVLIVGATLIAAGQALSLMVFQRLGKAGVFYGSSLGIAVPWCDAFPFTWFRHPQYVGTVLAIWGFFILMRFPASDWMAIPLLETMYYVLGAHFERDRSGRGALIDRARSRSSGSMERGSLPRVNRR